MGSTGSPSLVVTDARGRRVVPIDKELFTIGRRTETDLRLDGADISRVHAEIVNDKSVFTIRDRASRFGTFVNGERIQKRTRLQDGDQIVFGRTRAIVRMIDATAPTMTAPPI